MGKMSKKATTSLLLSTTKLLGLVFSGSLSSSFGTQSVDDSWALLLVHSVGLLEEETGKGKAAAMVQKGQVSGG